MRPILAPFLKQTYDLRLTDALCTARHAWQHTRESCVGCDADMRTPHSECLSGPCFLSRITCGAMQVSVLRTCRACVVQCGTGLTVSEWSTQVQLHAIAAVDTVAECIDAAQAEGWLLRTAC